MNRISATFGDRAAIRSVALSVSVSLALGGWAPALAQPGTQPPSRGGGDLSITVHYRGKAPVTRGHEIGIFLFDTPDIGGTRKPIAVKVLEDNGATASFTGLPAAAVYVAVSYDETGKHSEMTGPPPPGAPIHVHGIKGDPNALFDDFKSAPKPAAVTPGPGSKVVITFDDTYRSK
jgi:hypothetical protein